MTTAKSIAIIGAGPAGLSTAIALLRSGHMVEIFEALDMVGGLNRSIELGGQIVDIGPHRFLSDFEEVNDFWKEFMYGDDCLTIQRISYINYCQKLFSYPLQGFEAMRKLGFIEAGLCFLSYLKAKVFPSRSQSFEGYVSNAFGYRLYHHFFKGYTEKLWGMPCSQLDQLFAKQRIRNLNLFMAIKDAFTRDSKREDARSLNRLFQYPRLSMGQFNDKIAAEIERLGGKIHLNSPVTKIVTKDGKACGIIYGEGICFDCDCVVSTGVFTDLALSLDDISVTTRNLLKSLKFRNTRFAFIKVKPDCRNLPKASWIYINDHMVKCGRLTNFDMYSPALKKGQEEIMLCLEFWAQNEDELWQMSDGDFAQLVRKEIASTKMLAEDEILEVYSLKEEYTYPIYNHDITDIMSKITKDLDRIGDLYFVGRTGAFKYNNQDHSILMGLNCARKINGQYQGSLWEINNDTKGFSTNH